MQHSARWRALALLSSITILATGACGDDETATDAPTTTGAESTDTADVAAFCDAWIEAEEIYSQGPETDPETGEPTEDTLSAFVAAVQPHIAAITANTPEELGGDVTVVLDAVRQALSTGDPAATETEEFSAANESIDEFLFDNCEFADSVDLVGVDYAYEGTPETVSSGRIAFSFANQGEEAHEAIILRINDDAGMPIEDILALPEEEAMELTQFAGASFAPAGEDAESIVELDPGSYAFVCFLPVGATSPEALEGPELEDAPAHWEEGMVSTFTVS